ncbi:hypothetical protein ACA910_022599 [Epithemia clementina (nom. ined.)]
MIFRPPSSLWSFSSGGGGAAAAATKQHRRHVVEQRVLATPAAHLLAIVQNVALYSEFLPFCTHSAIVESKTTTTTTNNNNNNNNKRQQSQQQPPLQDSLFDQDRKHEFHATLTVGLLPPLWTETYTSHVQVFPHQYRIQTKSVESKWLESLESTWQLTPQLLPSNNAPTGAAALNTAAAANSQELSWELGQRPDSWCHVHFSMTLQTRDSLILQTLDQVLQGVAQQQVQAFERRCHAVPYLYYNAPPSGRPLS